MTPTLGALVDRLCILNLKIWHLQDWLYEVNRESHEAFAQRNPADTHVKLQQLAELNLDRNRVMDAIDRTFAAAIETGQAPQESRVKLT